MKLSKIKPNPDNPRILKTEKFEKLVKSIKEFPKMMALRPMVLDKDGIVLGGNMRLKALKKLGYKEIPDEWVKRADELTEEEQKRFIIVDNVGFGEWDWDELANSWDNEDLIDWGLEIPDFDEDIHLEAQEDDYTEPEQMQIDVVEGDLIEFVCKDGRVHRLVCGSSTEKETVERLIGKAKDVFVFTDPPYGIDVVNTTISGDKVFGKNGGNGLVKSNKYTPIIGDSTTETALLFYKLCLELGFVDFCIWGGNYFTDFLPPKKCWLVWGKKGRKWDDNFSDFEMAWTSFDKPAKIITYVWMGMVQSGEREKRVHPTQKPASFISDCISYLKEDAKIVYDGFLGSGSTMVAAHQLNRICYGLELDPKYCQVIIDRMTKLDNTLIVKINGKEYSKKAEEVPF